MPVLTKPGVTVVIADDGCTLRLEIGPLTPSFADLMGPAELTEIMLEANRREVVEEHTTTAKPHRVDTHVRLVHLLRAFGFPKVTADGWATWTETAEGVQEGRMVVSAWGVESYEQPWRLERTDRHTLLLTIGPTVLPPTVSRFAVRMCARLLVEALARGKEYVEKLGSS